MNLRRRLDRTNSLEGCGPHFYNILELSSIVLLVISLSVLIRFYLVGVDTVVIPFLVSSFQTASYRGQILPSLYTEAHYDVTALLCLY